jgi:hypothetical protein
MSATRTKRSARAVAEIESQTWSPGRKPSVCERIASTFGLRTAVIQRAIRPVTKKTAMSAATKIAVAMSAHSVAATSFSGVRSAR